ncbi:hypothetical protein P5V15_013437 [Pogonomyrmex californicus]
MEVDTENVGMDETDALMRADNDSGVLNSKDNDDDDAPTVEETYEITTTRRKTIRTSYKIQEVSCLTMCIHDDCRNRPVSGGAAAWAFRVGSLSWAISESDKLGTFGNANADSIN